MARPPSTPRPRCERRHARAARCRSSCRTRSSPRRARSATATRSRALCDPPRSARSPRSRWPPFAWAGNPAPRLHMTAGGGMLNSVGLQGPGVDAGSRTTCPRCERVGARVIASVWGRTVDDFAARGEAARARARRARRGRGERQLSEPRRPRPRCSRTIADAHRERRSRAVVDARARAAGVREAVAERHRSRRRSRGAAVDAGATGLTLVNTRAGSRSSTPSTRRPVLGGGGGGLSGPAIKPIALRAVHDVTRAHPGRADHRHRRCDDRASTRSRCCSPGATRGRRRHRDVPRPARDAAHRSTSSSTGARRTTSRASRDLIGALEDDDA